MPSRHPPAPGAATASAVSDHTVTPALRNWIVAQAQANVAAPALLQAMRDAGWAEDVAMAALQSTLRKHLALRAGPHTVPVPEPALHASPARIDVGDRLVDVLVSMAQPRLVVFANLLSPEECDALIDAARPHMARSLTVATRTGGDEVNEDRTSSGMFFARGENTVVQTLEARIAQLVNWPVENGEGLQVLHYRPGAEYKPHYDYFDPAEPGTPTLLQRGGQRVATLLVYLNTPLAGGSSTFAHAHLEVAAQRGNAVFFSYERPHPDTRTLHGGAPVLAGEKWIATKWLREREFS